MVSTTAKAQTEKKAKSTGAKTSGASKLSKNRANSKKPIQCDLGATVWIG